MKKNINIILTAIVAVTVFLTGCQKGDLLSNPNVVAESSTVPVSLILNHITANLMKEEEGCRMHYAFFIFEIHYNDVP